MSESQLQYGYSPAPSFQRPTETMAILALVFAFVVAPLGIVFGVIARRNITRNGNNGRGLATAGMWLGIIFTTLGLLYTVLVIVLIAVGASSGASSY